jgi:hypothetical protein
VARLEERAARIKVLAAQEQGGHTAATAVAITKRKSGWRSGTRGSVRREGDTPAA